MNKTNSNAYNLLHLTRVEISLENTFAYVFHVILKNTFSSGDGVTWLHLCSLIADEGLSHPK